ncbi:unnamed protein product [Clonostachys byssicola]|uniref:N-acetyltransferase domain-containing protein n=1 Tax=Clonostachys byssicola TaxID=160290 RepID=A0A9N9UCS0_9HYPO|nr:unnamed protein product [Clonostachys byssicola]
MTAEVPRQFSAADNCVTVRFATLADANRITELGAHVFAVTYGHSVEPRELRTYLKESYSKSSIIKDIQDGKKDVFVATNDENNFLGFAYLTQGNKEPCVETFERTIELQRLYVHPSSHGTGVGRLLGEAVETRAREQGFKNVWLGVWEDNPRAIRAYEKWGYKQVGVHDFAIGSVVQTDHIMVKAL